MKLETTRTSHGVEVIATLQQRLEVVEYAIMLWEDTVQRKEVGRPTAHGYDFLATATVKLWETRMFTQQNLAKIIGADAKTIRKWGARPDGYRRPRGVLNPQSLYLIRDVLRMRIGGTEPAWDVVIADLRDGGTTGGVVACLLGTTRGHLSGYKPSKKTLERILPATQPHTAEECDDADDLRPAHRPDDEGHPTAGEGSSADLHEDQADHGPERGEPIAELDYARDVLGAAERDPEPDSGAAESEAVVLEHGFLDPAKLTPEEYEQAVHDGNVPLYVDFDETGDALLASVPEQERGDGLAFEEWEQDFD